jgi:mRNA interferase MazF
MGICWATPSRRAAVEVPGTPALGKAVKRYEIRWAMLDPTLGSEMSKTRPVVIVSLDVLNDRLPTVTICPLTTQLHRAWRTRLGVRVGRRDAEIAVDQIRTISKARLGRKLGKLSERDAGALRRLITEMYGE